MKECLNDVLKTFIDDVAIEDIVHLKYTMSQNEIHEYVNDWVDEYAENNSIIIHKKFINIKKTLLTLLVEMEGP